MLRKKRGVNMDEKIKRKFLINLDEEDMDTQKKYFEWINKIIDEILLLKYTKGKKDIYLASALQLNELILYYFNQITKIGRASCRERV